MGCLILIENDVENYLTKRVKQHGGQCLKFVSPGNAGVPDRLIMWPGCIEFVELKRDANHHPRPLQVHWLKLIESYGISTYVIHNKSEVDSYIKSQGELLEI